MNQLPTKADVFKHYLHSRNNLLSSSNANPSVRDVCKLVTTDLISVRKRASISTVSEKFLLNRVILLADEANKVIRYQQTRSSTPYLVLRADFDKLFDISSCKCVERKAIDRNGALAKLKFLLQNGNFG